MIARLLPLGRAEKLVVRRPVGVQRKDHRNRLLGRQRQAVAVHLGNLDLVLHRNRNDAALAHQFLRAGIVRPGQFLDLQGELRRLSLVIHRENRHGAVAFHREFHGFILENFVAGLDDLGPGAPAAGRQVVFQPGGLRAIQADRVVLRQKRRARPQGQDKNRRPRYPASRAFHRVRLLPPRAGLRPFQSRRPRAQTAGHSTISLPLFNPHHNDHRSFTTTTQRARRNCCYGNPPFLMFVVWRSSCSSCRRGENSCRRGKNSCCGGRARSFHRARRLLSGRISASGDRSFSACSRVT